MYKIVRAYYHWIKSVSLSRSVSFEGSLKGVRDCDIKFGSNASVFIGKNVKIFNSKIDVIGGTLVIQDGVSISNYNVLVTKGCELYIGSNCVFEQGDNWRKPSIILWDESSLRIGNRNRLRCDIMCRFGGRCEIQNYNCVNERTELRCDENLSIGSFNMISYNCRIWDTNTHSFYLDDTRRKMTKQMYPNIGAEKDKPVTKPVFIGDDCLLGEESTVLKGSKIGDKCVVGIRAIVNGKAVPNGKTIVGNSIIV